jgi:hypothetical protein
VGWGHGATQGPKDRILFFEGRDDLDGIATCYGLAGPGIESLWGARFSAPVQTGPGAHPASYTIPAGSLSRGSGEAAGAWR